jgi:tetratricopeptide (TPR) repeat protein
MRVSAGALVLFLAGGAAGARPIDLPSKSDGWFRLTTANFTVFSNTTEGRAKEIALDLERLRAVLLYIRNAKSANAPVPSYLYVFKRMSALEPYMPPEYKDKFSGFVRVTEDANYLALSATWNSDPRGQIYDQYLLYYIHSNFRPQPLWYTVGAADFYRSFRATDSEAQIGLPVEEYLALLRGAKMIPLERLFVIDHTSPEYTDPHMLDVLYAESWALVHYLLRGSTPERKAQLGKFLVLMQDGKPSDAAFHEAFATDYATLLGELYAYVRQSRFNYVRIPYKDLAVPTEMKIEPLTHAETLFRLGDLLFHENEERFEEAETFFQTALREDPGLAAAETGLGEIAFQREDYAAAAEHFRKAVSSERADYRAYYWDGRLKMHQLYDAWSWPITPTERETLEAARAALRKSIALNPDFAEARVELGRSYLVEDSGHLGEGIAALTAASAVLPSRVDVANDLGKLKERSAQPKASDASESAEASPAPEVPSGNRAKPASARTMTSTPDTDAINALLAAGKEDEAVAAMEKLVAQADAQTRPSLQKELDRLKAGVARNKAVRAYNAAIALYNHHDYVAALSAFEKLAASSPDTEWGRKARDRAVEIRKILGK